jgi:protein-arginine kinase
MEDLQHIKNQLLRNDLFRAFTIQLAKDFEQSNFPADFVEALPPDYQQIVERIKSELQHHEKKSDFNLMHLLYRIDISEAQLNRYLLHNKDETYFHVLAELIIKRVLQKVVIKRYYRQDTNL